MPLIHCNRRDQPFTIRGRPPTATPSPHKGTSIRTSLQRRSGEPLEFGRLMERPHLEGWDWLLAHIIGLRWLRGGVPFRLIEFRCEWGTRLLKMAEVDLLLGTECGLFRALRWIVGGKWFCRLLVISVGWILILMLKGGVFLSFRNGFWNFYFHIFFTNHCMYCSRYSRKTTK